MSCDVGEVTDDLRMSRSVTKEKRKKGCRMSCDVGEATDCWRISCDVGEATEGLENELCR